MPVQIRLPSGIAQSVECQKFLFLNFSVCYTIKVCIAECSYFDWSETFAIMVRGVQVQILRTVFDFITLYIFFNGRSAKKRVLRVVGSSPTSLFENSSIWQSRASIILTVFEFLCLLFLSRRAFSVKIQSKSIYQNCQQLRSACL